MQSNRLNIYSGAQWEDKIGYSRAVKIGNHIYVSGTTAIDSEGNIVGLDNPFKQTLKCIENIESALLKADSSLNDVVRIRIYVTKINDWEKVGNGLSKFFMNIKPAATMVEVSKLISPEMLVEIEADAYISNQS